MSDLNKEYIDLRDGDKVYVDNLAEFLNLQGDSMSYDHVNAVIAATIIEAFAAATIITILGVIA